MNSTFFLKYKVWSLVPCHSSLLTLKHTHAGVSNYACVVNVHDMQVCNGYAEEPDPPAPLEFLLAVDELMVQLPSSIKDAILLYTELVTILEPY